MPYNIELISIHAYSFVVSFNEYNKINQIHFICHHLILKFIVLSPRKSKLGAQEQQQQHHQHMQQSSAKLDNRDTHHSSSGGSPLLSYNYGSSNYGYDGSHSNMDRSQDSDKFRGRDPRSKSNDGDNGNDYWESSHRKSSRDQYTPYYSQSEREPSSSTNYNAPRADSQKKYPGDGGHNSGSTSNRYGGRGNDYGKNDHGRSSSDFYKYPSTSTNQNRSGYAHSDRGGDAGGIYDNANSSSKRYAFDYGGDQGRGRGRAGYDNSSRGFSQSGAGSKSSNSSQAMKYPSSGDLWTNPMIYNNNSNSGSDKIDQGSNSHPGALGMNPSSAKIGNNSANDKNTSSQPSSMSLSATLQNFGRYFSGKSSSQGNNAQSKLLHDFYK